jgi:hypothetical protein
MNCTPRRLLLFLSAAMLASGIASAAPQSKGPVTYRWVDEQGVVHYGDTVPPQYAAKDREIINGDGVPVGHLDAQKTAEQLAAEEHQRVEMIKQKEHDSFLVTTYTSVKDIEALRDARLEQLRAQQGAAEQYVESLRSRLTALEARALTYRPYSDNANARRMPDTWRKTWCAPPMSCTSSRPRSRHALRRRPKCARNSTPTSPVTASCTRSTRRLSPLEKSPARRFPTSASLRCS